MAVGPQRSEHMFDRLGIIVSRYPALVLLGWVVVSALVFLCAPRWDDVTRDGDFAYLPQRMPSVAGEKLLRAAFPDTIAQSQAILVIARNNGPLLPPDYAVADELAQHFTPETDRQWPIVEVLSHETPIVGEKLISPISPNGQATLVVLPLRSESMAVGNAVLVKEIDRTLSAIQSRPGFPAGLRLGMTGSAAVGSDMSSAIDESMQNTERATIALVVLILLAIYRAPGLLLVPLVTIFTSLTVAMGLVALAAQLCDQWAWIDFKIFKTTRIFVVVILFGAGTDFCLFLISRYREELARGLDPAAAIARAVGRVGGTVTASAMTTVLGLAMMACCQFGKFRSSGPAIALCLTVGLAASLTLAPAILRVAGWAVFWPFARKAGKEARGAAADLRAESDVLGVPLSALLLPGFWERLSRWILARPGRILLGSFVALAPLAYYGSCVEVTYDVLSELPADCPSVVGTRLLRRFFPAGEAGPVTLLAYRAAGGLEDTGALRKMVLQLTRNLNALRYEDSLGIAVRPITGIRSLVEPLGDRPQKSGARATMLQGIVRARTKKTFLAQSPQYAGKVVRFELVLFDDPFSQECIRLLDCIENRIQQWVEDPGSPWQGTRFYCLGTTAEIRDLKAVTSGDLRRIEQLVPLIVLGVLMVILRRPVVSIFLILSVLLGYLVSIGVTKLLFEWIYGPHFVGLDWQVPIYLFILLIAVGEDYNIYLATRVLEEQKLHGAQKGLHVALVRTGGIITSCGLIMAGTFASMITGTLAGVQELGVALTFGVLLDTLVIRTVLVPAFLSLWERSITTIPGRDTTGPLGGVAPATGRSRRTPMP